MTSNSTSVFQHALEIWKAADLPNLQQSLDDSILEIKRLESKTLESRKNLALETKRFKKLENDAKIAQLNKIIKQYQVEIDTLTSRSKYSEQRLVEIYGKLSEAPDPRPLLQSSVDEMKGKATIQEVELQNKALKDRLAKVADYDKLKERLLELEQYTAKTLSKRLIAKEQELNSKWEEKERNWDHREQELMKQLENIKNSNKVLESKLSRQSELGDKDVPVEEYGAESSSNHVQSAELELLSHELESTQLRVLELERRNEDLSGKLAKATSQADKDSEVYSRDLKINQLESENALLVASLEREKASLEELVKSKAENERSLQQKLVTYESEFTSIRRKLAGYADYEQIKEELVALKRIEFGAMDDGDDSSDNDTTQNSRASNDTGVETTLITTNKKLQNNIVELRGKNQELQMENKSLCNRLSVLQKQLEELESLNSKLEADLGKIEDVSSKFSDTTSIMSGMSRQVTNRVGRISPTSSIFGIPEEGEMVPPSSSARSILPIVTQQRDRMRSKNMELERQLKQNALDQGKLKSEIGKLKKDNHKLYERIRYLSSYGNINAHRGGSLSSDNNDVEAQYAAEYEESLHPLADFKKRERLRYKKKKMSPLERIFLNIANTVLATKATRMFFMFYCLGLHALVLLMSLYVIDRTEDTKTSIGL